eukprot:Platyproteum_vivax@DN6777_c0_g1_i1.p1
MVMPMMMPWRKGNYPVPAGVWVPDNMSPLASPRRWAPSNGLKQSPFLESYSTCASLSDEWRFSGQLSTNSSGRTVQPFFPPPTHTNTPTISMINLPKPPKKSNMASTYDGPINLHPMLKPSRCHHGAVLADTHNVSQFAKCSCCGGKVDEESKHPDVPPCGEDLADPILPPPSTPSGKLVLPCDSNGHPIGIPLDANGKWASLGSLLHEAGTCKPCLFYSAVHNRCVNGWHCQFCHLTHPPRPKKNRPYKKARQERRMRERAFKLSAPEGVYEDEYSMQSTDHLLMFEEMADLLI